MADAAATRGYALTVVTLGAHPDVPAAFERLSEQGVDGVVVLNEATAAARETPAPPGLSLVVVDAPPEAEGARRFGIVQSDHAGGARAATTHLLELGHRTVHHLGGPATSFACATLLDAVPDSRTQCWGCVTPPSLGARSPLAARGRGRGRLN